MNDNRLRLTVLSLLIFALLSHAQTVASAGHSHQSSAAPETDTSVRLADYFDRVAGLGFSGAVLVAKDGKVILRNGYGWADEKRRIPVRPETVFDIGSITKVFTAVAVMQLFEQSKLNTTDPITKYFPNVPKDKTTITIHHLLTHTSGLAHEDFYSETTPDIRQILKNRDQFIQRILSFPLAFEPGTKRLYSNSGFSFLAAIVEKLSGQTYESYLREKLLRPAGMTNTGYVIPKWNNKLVARGYNDGPTDYGYPWTTQWSGKVIPWDLLGNGGLLSTIDDMHRFVVALRDGKLVSPKTKATMFTVYSSERDQAYGWFVSKTEKGDHVFINHGGDAVPQGWNADLRWFKDDNLIAIVLTNKRVRAGSVRRYAMNDLVDIALFNKRPALPEFVRVDPSPLGSYVGTYKLPSSAAFQVTASEAAFDGGKTKPILMIGGKGQQAIDLLFSANSTPGLSKLSLELNEKTRAYIEALRNNDLAALKAIPAEESSADGALKSWNDFVKQNGRLEGFEILGTSPLNQAGVQTFARLDFQKTPGFYHVTWRDQKLHVQDEDSMQPKITNFLRRSFVRDPLNLPFLPQSVTDFATYDPFKGRTIRITFANNSLIVHTQNGDVLAKKVAQPDRSKTITKRSR
jgi:CubicO group peptidase (beta-lactamase class C family)